MVEDLDDIAPNHEFNRVIEMIEDARAQTYRAVNTSLIDLYWNIGNYLSNQIATGNWGKGVVKSLATHIKLHDTNIHGFSARISGA